MQGLGEKEFIYMLNVWCKGSGCIYVQVCLFPIVGNYKVLSSFDMSGVCACTVYVYVCACMRVPMQKWEQSCPFHKNCQ